MKSNFLFIILLLAVGATGCSLFGKHETAPKPAAAAPPPIVTPDASLEAKVISVNTIGRFVVLGFSTSQLPSPGQTLFVYRAGLKVAQIRLTGPRQENNM